QRAGQWLYERTWRVRHRSLVAAVDRRDLHLHAHGSHHRVLVEPMDGCSPMRRQLFAFLSGGLFTAGLTLGGMTQPHKVRAFLDFAGDWDPSLAFVMMGAIGVYALLYRLGTGRAQPWHSGEFALPTKRRIDASLLLGAAIFGVGWG